MIFVGIIWIGFGCLIYLARKEKGDLLQRCCMYLYKQMSISKIWHRQLQKQDRKIVNTLRCLHPGSGVAELLSDYYIGKLRLVLAVLLAGSLLALCVSISGEKQGVSVDDGMVKRGEGTETIRLEARVKDEGKTIREEIVLDVEERLLRTEEAEELYPEFAEKLEGWILGENVSAREIREDLYLPDEVEGYPFIVNWISTDTTLLSNDGKVQVEHLDQEKEVLLRAEICYGEKEWQYGIRLTLLPPLRTEREQMVYDLNKYSKAAEEEFLYEESFVLPQDVGGKEVVWRQKRENTGRSILLLTFAAAVGVYCLKDRDLQEDLVKRRMQIRLAYPELVSKYALLLGAGMTVRGAFQKICGDYYAKRQDDEIHPLYEEMLYSCNELRSGVSESKVYESFGLRTGVQEYTRLSTLLTQNLKKGNSALVKRLREEGEEALAEGSRLQKRRGEEAGTRLLLPMIMMLLMVLVMIMLPAFSGLGV